jgi:hypothetical protein
MRPALVVAAVGEATTGLALLIAPTLMGRLLLGADPSGVGTSVAQVAGIALIGLGIACWPGPPICGMLVYSTGVMLLLGWFGLTATTAGILLWPAVILHAALSVALALAWRPKPGH